LSTNAFNISGYAATTSFVESTLSRTHLETERVLRGSGFIFPLLKAKLILSKIVKTVATKYQVLRQNTPNSISVGVPPPDRAGKLTVSLFTLIIKNHS